MIGFTQSDFPDRETYWKHKVNLDRAQASADRVLGVFEDNTVLFRRNPGLYTHVQRLMHYAAQLGYEVGIGKVHRTIDYDISPETLTYDTKCLFCKHHYLVYNCEDECARKKSGLDCKLEVRETFE